MSDLYALLGVRPDSTEDEIRAAYYRRLQFDQPVTDEESGALAASCARRTSC